MAIFHLNVSHGSRQGGQSAVAKLAYVLREGKYARGRDHLVAAGSGNLPDWCDGDAARLFAAADRYERANGRLYVEVEGALPIELDDGQHVELVEAFMTGLASGGLPYAYGIHAGRPPAAGAAGNPHFHALLSERINDGIPRNPQRWFRRANSRDPVAGGAAKDRSLKGHRWVDGTRNLYARLVNEALERAGRPERVTAESHRTRIARAEAVGDHETAEALRLHPPGVHVGPTACAIERGGPGRPERTTERGERARARVAEARRLRAEVDSVERELREHERVAVAAARDAGVGEDLVATAQSGDPDEVIALDVATDRRRQEIRAAAWAVGLDDEAIKGVRRAAEPEEPELGWRAVVEATAERRERKTTAESAARNVGLTIDAVYEAAGKRDVDPVGLLKQETANRRAEIIEAAREAWLDDAAIECLYYAAESRKAGSGWRAVVDGTLERRRRKASAETAAENDGLYVPVIYGEARAIAPAADPVLYLEMIPAARRVLLNQKAIAKIIREAESQQAGSGLGALAEVIEARRERKDAVETAARGLDLERDPSDFWEYCEIAPDTDPIDELEEIIARRTRDIVAAARGVQLRDEEIVRIRDEAESGQPASGMRAVVQATRAREADIREAARAASLDPREIERIRDLAELEKAGSGWSAVVAETAERNERRLAAELAARNVGLDVDAVTASGRELDEDPVSHLERAVAQRKVEIVTAAREVLLDDEAVARIRATSESKVPGSGWATLAAETTVRRKKKAAAESQAGECGLDVATIYAAAAEQNADPIEALEREIRYETLVGQSGGRDLYTAWLTELDPAQRSRGEPAGELFDRILDAAESDSRLERLTRALGHADAASCYQGKVDTGHPVTLSLIDEALEAAEGIVRRGAVAAEQRDLGSAVPTADLRLARKIERAVEAAEAALPTAPRNQDGPDSTMPAVSDSTLDWVEAADPNVLFKELVDAVRDQHDEALRRECEAQHLAQAATIEHDRATRLWKASQDGPRPTRDSVEATVREKHRSAVLNAFRIACDGTAGHGEPGALTSDERGRLARYLSEERLPVTTPYPGNPSHRPFAVSDRTLKAAEAAAGTRRVAETIAAIRSEHWYTASPRKESERAYDWKKGTGPEEIRDVVIKIVEDAWRRVDGLDLPAARREFDRRDNTRGGRGIRRTDRPATFAERSGPTQDVPSRKTPEKRQVSTRADEAAPTDDEPGRGWRGG